MERILDAVEAEALRDPLSNEGTLDTMLLLEVGGGGLRSTMGTGLAYCEARSRLVLHVCRGGCTIDDAELYSLLDRVVHEDESTKFRAAAAGGGPGASLGGRPERRAFPWATSPLRLSVL